MMNFNETIKQLTSSTRNHASNFNEVNNQLLENTIYNKAHHELLKEQVKALEESSQTTEWEEVIGKPTTYPPENHSHDWDSLQGKPSTFPVTEHRHNVREIDGLDNIGGEVKWNSITGKPNTFPPSSHTHTKSQISDFPTSLPANGGNADTVDGKHASDFASSNHTHDKASVGLGNVNNWGASSAINNASTTTYATSNAVKQVNDKVIALSNSGGGIKSIQRGTLSVASDVPKSITINVVNVNKSFLLTDSTVAYGTNNQGDNRMAKVMGYIESPTTIQFTTQSGLAYEYLKVAWQVVEFY